MTFKVKNVFRFYHPKHVYTDRPSSEAKHIGTFGVRIAISVFTLGVASKRGGYFEARWRRRKAQALSWNHSQGNT